MIISGTYIRSFVRDKSYSSEKAHYVTAFDGYPDQYYLIRLPRLQESPFLPHGAMVIEGLREKQGLGDPTIYGARNKDFGATFEEARV